MWRQQCLRNLNSCSDNSYIANEQGHTGYNSKCIIVHGDVKAKICMYVYV